MTLFANAAVGDESSAHSAPLLAVKTGQLSVGYIPSASISNSPIGLPSSAVPSRVYPVAHALDHWSVSHDVSTAWLGLPLSSDVRHTISDSASSGEASMALRP